jgi:hypothetical protein
MVRKRFGPGSVMAIELETGQYTYGLIRNYIEVSYFKLITEQIIFDLESIVESEVLFSVSTCKTAFKKWEKIGQVELSSEMKKYMVTFMQSDTNFERCSISNENGDEYKATPEECIGLERDSVWRAEHVEERILDEIAGRTNKYVENQKVKLTRH